MSSEHVSSFQTVVTATRKRFKDKFAFGMMKIRAAKSEKERAVVFQALKHNKQLSDSFETNVRIAIDSISTSENKISTVEYFIDAFEKFDVIMGMRATGETAVQKLRDEKRGDDVRFLVVKFRESVTVAHMAMEASKFEFVPFIAKNFSDLTIAVQEGDKNFVLAVRAEFEMLKELLLPLREVEKLSILAEKMGFGDSMFDAPRFSEKLGV